MNDKIDFSAITACGECCTDCAKKLKGLCGGCIETDGNCQEWTGGCEIYKCCRKNNVQFCGLCDKFPCIWLVEKITWNADAISNIEKLARIFKEQK